MALAFVSGGILLLCAVTCALRDYEGMFQQSPTLPQDSSVVECKDQFLSISVAIPPSGNEPHFEAVDATGVYPVTQDYAVQCGYTYSAQPLSGRVVLRASYFSCHTDNQNDEVFTFMFRVITVNENGEESYFNISQTCSVPPFSPREVTCEENYMQVSVRIDLPCPTAATIKDDFSAAYSLAQSSAVDSWQVILQQGGQTSAVMSTLEAATLGYFIMVTPGRLVFRTTFGQPYASVKMVNGVQVEFIQATVFFRQNWMVVMVDLTAACSLDEGSFDGYSLQWKTPAVMTPLVAAPSELRSEYIGMGVDGEVVDAPVAVDRGYSLTVRDQTIESSIPFAAEGGTRRSFVMGNVYHEVYTVQLNYQHTSVDQSGVATKQTAVRQMSTPPIPRSLYAVNQTVPEEQVFTVYLGNVPFDVELVSVELNGQEIPVSTAEQMGYSITKVPEDNNTFAYILRVPFQDPLVLIQHVSEVFFVYSLDIKWTLTIMPQMDPYYYKSPVSATLQDVSTPTVPPVFNGMCADGGISFMKKNQESDYLWDITIGNYPLTQQLASDRGYILTNDSSTLTLDVPLFTIGYTYENITLQHFYGTFELLTRNAKTLAVEQSSAQRCLFQTTELLVCSTEGVMTVVSDITKAVPTADPARTTLLDPSCRPQETDESRVLFSFALNTCGTRFQIDQQYVAYENEIIFHELYSTDSKPVITRDAAYRITVRCVYPVSGTETILVDRKVSADTPGIGQIKDPVKVPPQELKPVQQQTIMKPFIKTALAQKSADYMSLGQWGLPVDKRSQWSLGP